MDKTQIIETFMGFANEAIKSIMEPKTLHGFVFDRICVNYITK